MKEIFFHPRPDFRKEIPWQKLWFRFFLSLMQMEKMPFLNSYEKVDQRDIKNISANWSVFNGLFLLKMFQEGKIRKEKESENCFFQLDLKRPSFYTT